MPGTPGDEASAEPGGCRLRAATRSAARSRDGLKAEDSAVTGRVATLVERSRYSRGPTEADAAATLPALTNEIRRGLATPLSRRRRVLGLILPGSLFHPTQPES